MSWRYKYIDDPGAAYAESQRYMSAIAALLMVPGNQDAALYSRLDVETGGIHYYFTPAALAVASAFGAEPCEKPSRTDLGKLLVGDVTLIARLYP